MNGLEGDQLEELRKLCKHLKKPLQAEISVAPEVKTIHNAQYNYNIVSYWPPINGDQVVALLDRVPELFSVSAVSSDFKDFDALYSPSSSPSEFEFSIDDEDAAIVDFGARRNQYLPKSAGRLHTFQVDVTVCFVRLDNFAWMDPDPPGDEEPRSTDIRPPPLFFRVTAFLLSACCALTPYLAFSYLS